MSMPMGCSIGCCAVVSRVYISDGDSGGDGDGGDGGGVGGVSAVLAGLQLSVESIAASG